MIISNNNRKKERDFQNDEAFIITYERKHLRATEWIVFYARRRRQQHLQSNMV